MGLSTKQKLRVARLLFAVLRRFVRTERRIRRNGVAYEVDLAEGLDLSLFLFGDYQRHVTGNRWIGPRLRPLEAPVILDVGANFGIMSLAFARSFPTSRVYAFEPTPYALGKLRRNLALNPALAARIEAVHSYVSAASGPDPGLKAFSSWRLDGASAGAHPVHGGTETSEAGVAAVSVDDFVAARRLPRVDLVKVDTDGHDFQVLAGAAATLARHRPLVIFEVGAYLLREEGLSFADYERLLLPHGYRLLDSASGKPVTAATQARLIPARGTIDVIALPPG